MAIQKQTHPELSPEQAKSKVVGGLANLSPGALNELVVFVEFLHLREQAAKQNQKTVQVAAEADYDISEFAGMLSDLTAEEMQHFDEVVKRRPLFADRKINL